MSVNLSPRDFDRGSALESIEANLRRHGLPPSSLEVEITESVMMQDTSEVMAKVEQLRRQGVGIAIDDFGTGYSALAYLQKFPVNTLKIDKSFVQDLESPGMHPIVSAITGIARGFGLHLIAEGVETASQAEVLHALGCDCMQGYHFSRPLAAPAALRFLSEFPSVTAN